MNSSKCLGGIICLFLLAGAIISASLFFMDTHINTIRYAGSQGDTLTLSTFQIFGIDISHGLIGAAEDNNEESMRWLLEHGAYVDVRYNGLTPLWFATYNKHENIIEILLEHGAYVDATSDDGSTSLHWAIMHDAPDVVKVLLKRGAYVNAKDNDGRTPLHFVSWLDDWKAVNVMKLLLINGANANSRDNEGQSPLHYVARSYNLQAPKLINILLDHGANINIIDNKGRTPLRCANYLAEQALRKRGAR